MMSIDPAVCHIHHKWRNVQGGDRDDVVKKTKAQKCDDSGDGHRLKKLNCGLVDSNVFTQNTV